MLSLRSLIGAATIGTLSTSLALAGGGYDLSWHTIDCGGGTSTGGAFELSGTIGQPDAGGPMTAGTFTVTGGFWAVDGGAVPTCPEDLTGDNLINVLDMLALLGEWGACASCDADFNSDGMVDVLDLLSLLSAWGACP